MPRVMRKTRKMRVVVSRIREDVSIVFRLVACGGGGGAFFLCVVVMDLTW